MVEPPSSVQTPLPLPAQQFGPRHLFVLQLEDQSFIWVSMQLKFLTGPLQGKKLQKAVLTTAPDQYWVNKNGHHYAPVQCPTLVQDTRAALKALPGPDGMGTDYPLIRVIATSSKAQIGIDELDKITRDYPGDTHPLCVLNWEHLFKTFGSDSLILERILPFRKSKRPSGWTSDQNPGPEKRGRSAKEETDSDSASSEGSDSDSASSEGSDSDSDGRSALKKHKGSPVAIPSQSPVAGPSTRSRTVRRAQTGLPDPILERDDDVEQDSCLLHSMASPSAPSTTEDFEAQLKAAHEQSLRNLTARHESVDDVDLASLFLSHILAKVFLTARRPIDGDLLSLWTSVALLSSKPALHETLKLAHAEKDYTRVAESPLIPTFFSANVREYLENLRPEMEKVVRGEKTMRLWSPDKSLGIDEDTLRHIESLNLPCLPGLIGRDCFIILHDLGAFKDNPVLKDRTARIFTRQNKFLVNASGTGKTRLLYEGLCVNWGFYFTVGVDSGRLGIRDIENALMNELDSSGFNEFPSVDPEAMKRNSQVVSCVFSRLLLARLLIFQLFLEIATADGLTEEHKKRWLLMQLSPSLLVAWGPASIFFPASFQELPEIMAKEDNRYVGEDIADALRKIRKLLGEDAHLFLVLDEAQASAHMFPEAFADGNSLLTEIMRVWGSHTADEHTLIFAGTDIPKTVLEGDEGNTGYAWCSGTGGFETAEAQGRYVSSFLPASFLSSPSGSLLISRTSNWLLGRHRFTSAFVSAMLSEGLKTPHTRFNAFIKGHTGLNPLDATEQVVAERNPREEWQLNFHAFDFSRIPPSRCLVCIAADQNYLDVKHIFLDILFRYMATHEAPPPLGPEHLKLVNEGYARCVDSDLSRITIDEPIVLVSAARKLLPHPSSRPWQERFLSSQPNNYPATFVGSMRLNAPRTPQALSYCLAFYLSYVFSDPRPLEKVFTFPHKVPAWAKQSAQLVKFHRDGSLEVGYSEVAPEDSSPLATDATLVEDTISWLEHQSDTAFCLPSSSTPDLLFALKLADKSFIWVALRAIASTDSISHSELETAIAQLKPDSLFTDEGDDMHARAIGALQALPHRLSKVNKHSLLRVVAAFPAEIDLDPCVNKRVRDVASLNLAALEGTEDEVTQPEFFDSIVAGVLAGQKRKSAWSEDEEAPEGSSLKCQKSAEPPADVEPAEPMVPPRKKGKAREPADEDITEPSAPLAPRKKGKAKELVDAAPVAPVAAPRKKGKTKAAAEEPEPVVLPDSGVSPKKKGKVRVQALTSADTPAHNTRSKIKAAEGA